MEEKMIKKSCLVGLEMKDLKTENCRLREMIDDLHNNHRSLEVQVSKLMEDIASQYLLYRDEYDARKLLIADINELHFQQEEQMISKQSMEALDGEKEDPLMLKLALR